MLLRMNIWILQYTASEFHKCITVAAVPQSPKLSCKIAAEFWNCWALKLYYNTTVPALDFL